MAGRKKPKTIKGTLLDDSFRISRARITPTNAARYRVRSNIVRDVTLDNPGTPFVSSKEFTFTALLATTLGPWVRYSTVLRVVYAVFAAAIIDCMRRACDKTAILNQCRTHSPASFVLINGRFLCRNRTWPIVQPALRVDPSTFALIMKQSMKVTRPHAQIQEFRKTAIRFMKRRFPQDEPTVENYIRRFEEAHADFDDNAMTDKLRDFFGDFE